jgi:2-oxo-3-hexenedioate decarboxylase
MTDVMEDAAKVLDKAALDVSGIEQLGLKVGKECAYEIQAQSIGRRVARGERLIGVKMGMTSKAKMIQVNLNEVLWGRLTDAMLHENGGTLVRSRFIQPRAEPEIAFLLKAPLSGVVTAEQAWEAIGGVAAAIEILDSRFKDFKFNVDDAIADNCSSSALFVGPWQAPDVNCSDVKMVMEIDGAVVAEGPSSAILGDPINSLIEGARLTAQYGASLRAGDIFMSGAATAAIPLKAGQRVRLSVPGFEDCSFSVV